MSIRIERVVTSGLLSRGGQSIELENNVWIVGNDADVIVIDAAHDADAIVAAVNGRNVTHILLTHGHEDHVNAALDLQRQVDAPLYLHPEDNFLWDELHSSRPDEAISDGQVFTVVGTDLTTIHTPGHTPGSVCFALPDLETVFTGDTLFHGGPGATRWSYSSFPQIIHSITTRLSTLPEWHAALPGHGISTTLGAEADRLQAWVNRGCGSPTTPAS